MARLEKLGLIERRLGPGRGVGLYLTEAGRQMAGDAVTREQEVNAQLRELLRESHDILRETR